VFLGFFYALCPECPAMTVDNWGTFGTWKESVYLKRLKKHAKTTSKTTSFLM